MSSSTALEGATPNADGSFNLTVDEVRVILEDNAALLAENQALRESQTLERAALQEFMALSGERAAVLEQENALLKMRNEQLERKVRVSAFRGGAVGTIIGLCIGLAF